MNNVYLEYDEFKMQYKISKDGVPVGINSQLMHFAKEPFVAWFDSILKSIAVEINEEFCFEYRGNLLTHLILSRFADREVLCKEYTFRESYTMRQRLAWLLEILYSTKRMLPIPIPECNIFFPDENSISAWGEQKGIIIRNNETLSYTLNNVEFAKLYRSSESTMIEIVSQDEASTNAEYVYRITEKKDILFDEVKGSQFFFSGARECIGRFLAIVVENALLPEWLAMVAKALDKQTTQNAKSFEVYSRVKMLTRYSPCMRISMPTRVEEGTASHYSYKLFPLEALEFIEGDPSVFEINRRQILAKKRGLSELIVKINGSESARIPIEVYSVNRVQNIALNIPKSSIMVGDVFTIDAKYIPDNAENIDLGKWISKDSNICRYKGRGEFQAVNAGQCQIQHVVENVSKEITINVFPEANRLILTASSISIRLNNLGEKLQYQVFPTQSIYDAVHVTVVDKGVVRYDDKHGNIQPIKEGKTDIIFHLIGRGGNQILEEKCTVTILPIHDIVTPEWPSMISVICLIAAVLMQSTPLAVVPNICSIISGFIWVRKSRRNKREMRIGTVVIIIAIILLFVSI